MTADEQCKKISLDVYAARDSYRLPLASGVLEAVLTIIRDAGELVDVLPELTEITLTDPSGLFIRWGKPFNNVIMYVSKQSTREEVFGHIVYTCRSVLTRMTNSHNVTAESLASMWKMLSIIK